MTDLRRLSIQSLDDAVEESRRLSQSGYTRRGEWSLGEICHHLRSVQDGCIDGYPWWMSLFAPIRPVLRWRLMPKIEAEDPPRGVRTAAVFIPPGGLSDIEEVEAFAKSTERLVKYDRPFRPHPAFGRLAKNDYLRVHAEHARHHLRFLEPAVRDEAALDS